MKSTPVFRVDKTDIKNPKVIIQCSNCEDDIRQMCKEEVIHLNVGIYCPKCDDGVIHLNVPVKE